MGGVISQHAWQKTIEQLIALLSSELAGPVSGIHNK